MKLLKLKIIEISKYNRRGKAMGTLMWLVLIGIVAGLLGVAFITVGVNSNIVVCAIGALIGSYLFRGVDLIKRELLFNRLVLITP